MSNSYSRIKNKKIDLLLAATFLFHFVPLHVPFVQWSAIEWLVIESMAHRIHSFKLRLVDRGSFRWGFILFASFLYFAFRFWGTLHAHLTVSIWICFGCWTLIVVCDVFRDVSIEKGTNSAFDCFGQKVFFFAFSRWNQTNQNGYRKKNRSSPMALIEFDWKWQTMWSTQKNAGAMRCVTGLTGFWLLLTVDILFWVYFIYFLYWVFS